MTDHVTPKGDQPPKNIPQSSLVPDGNNSEEDIKKRVSIMEKEDSGDLQSNKSEISPGSKMRMGATPTIIVDNDCEDDDDDSHNHGDDEP